MATKTHDPKTVQVWCARPAEDPPFKVQDAAREAAAGMRASDHDLEAGKRWVGFTFSDVPVDIIGEGRKPQLGPGEKSCKVAAAIQAAFPGDEVCISTCNQDFDLPRI